MQQILTLRRKLAVHVATLWLAGCAAPPVVAPPPRPTIEAPATAPGGTVRAAVPAYQWSAKLASAAQRLRSTLQGGEVNVLQTTEQRLWVSLPADQAFAPGRSAVKPPATGWLDQVAVALREVPRAEVQVVSDSDSGGSAATTRVLALDRAASARDWLVSRGVPAQRIAVAGRSALPASAGDQRRLDILIGERASPAP